MKLKAKSKDSVQKPIKLTAKSIDSIKLDGKKDRIAYDTEIPGFGLRVRAGGKRTLVYSYRFNGESKRFTLGSASPETFGTLKDAKGAIIRLGMRERVLQMQANLKRGIDPGAERDTNKAPAENDFGSAARRYLGLLPARTKKNGQPIRATTVYEAERYLLINAAPLHSKPIATITKADIAGLLSSTAAKAVKGPGLVTANRLRSTLSALFTWCLTEGLAESNPTVDTIKRGEAPRARTLVDPENGDMAELVRVLKALDNSIFSDLVWLLALTGQRKNEIAGLRWSELDEGMTRIKLPETRTKNGLPHLVPLSDAAREIIARQPRIVGQDPVFGFTSWSRYKKALDAKLPGMAPWVVHDLRRSCATGLAQVCGIQPYIIESVLNHQSGSKRGVAGIYNLATYLKEKTTALNVWAAHLEAAVAALSTNVVQLRA